MMVKMMRLLIKLDDNDSCNILSTYYMPRTMLYMLFNLIFTATL